MKNGETVLAECTDILGLVLDDDMEYRALVWLAYNMGKGTCTNELTSDTIDRLHKEYKEYGYNI